MSEADDGIQEMFPPRVGDLLRAAREAQGLSIEEIAGRTRVPSRHLATIESGDLSRLPAAPYSAGFIKSYARIVGLNEAELSRAFRDELAIHGDEHAASMPFAPADPSRIAPRGLAWAAAIVAVLLIVGYLVLRNMWGDDPETRAQLAAQTTPPPEVAPAATPPPAAPAPVAPAAPAASADASGAKGVPSGPVVLTALAPVWVRVYDRVGNTTLFMGELAAGQAYEVPASAADPLIRTGRAESLRVTVGGAEAPRLGPPDTTLPAVSLRPDALFSVLVSTRRERPVPGRPRRSAAVDPAATSANSAAPVIPALPAAGPAALTVPKSGDSKPARP